MYCSRWFYGSPAHKYGLRATTFVTELNGTPTRNLDEFCAAAAEIQRQHEEEQERCLKAQQEARPAAGGGEDGGPDAADLPSAKLLPIRVRTVDLNARKQVYTLFPDYHYFPTSQVSWAEQSGQWELS